MTINNFLGYTDGIKEPQKTRIENNLNKLYRADAGKILEAKNLIICYITSGYTPEKATETYTKRTGEVAEKVSYRLIKNNIFLELKKIEYDFSCYLIDNNFTSAEAIEKYEKEEAEKMEKIRLEKEHREEEKKAIEEEKKLAMEMINKELEKITEEEKALVNSIFLDIYGEEKPWNYSIIPLIHHFNNKYCKEEIISRLHNDNRASIKIFECITGLKLPKTNRDRREFLQSITTEDFKEMNTYKARKKISNKTIETEAEALEENRKTARKEAMKRFLKNAGDKEALKKPHFYNGKYVFLHNSCIVETEEDPKIKLYEGSKTFNADKILKSEPTTTTEKINIIEIRKKASAAGWNRKKHGYVTKIFNAIYDITLLDLAYSIINNGKEAEAYLINGNDGKAPILLKTEIGKAVVLPIYRGKNSDYSDLIFIE